MHDDQNKIEPFKDFLYKSNHTFRIRNESESNLIFGIKMFDSLIRIWINRIKFFDSEDSILIQESKSVDSIDSILFKNQNVLTLESNWNQSNQHFWFLNQNLINWINRINLFWFSRIRIESSESKNLIRLIQIRIKESKMLIPKNLIRFWRWFGKSLFF